MENQISPGHLDGLQNVAAKCLDINVTGGQAYWMKYGLYGHVVL